jgi:hypothetical protein
MIVVSYMPTAIKTFANWAENAVPQIVEKLELGASREIRLEQSIRPYPKDQNRQSQKSKPQRPQKPSQGKG